MQIALVLGSAIATVKHSTMIGQKLLVVQPLMADGRSCDGDPFIAVDPLGAGAGERVMVSSDGKYTREFLKQDDSPVRWIVIGVCDDSQLDSHYS